MKEKAKRVFVDNGVTLLFCMICMIGIWLAKQPMSYIIGEISTRLFRNLILILALLVPVWAGMGLNFSIVLGAMAAQIGVIASVNFSVPGVVGLILAFAVSIPISICLGTMTGKLFNQTKGQEMITGMILGFFAKGVYDLVFMFLCGPVIPVSNKALMLPNGIGLTTPINLDSSAKNAINEIAMISLDKALAWLLLCFLVWQIGRLIYRRIKKGEPICWNKQHMLFFTVVVSLLYAGACAGSESFLFALRFTDIPVVTGLIIVAVCAYISFLSKTKLGSDILAVGQDRKIAASMGIPVDKIRITAIVISTVLAALGQLIFIQEIGNFTTYTAHENVGTFSIAALLVGGASIKKATIGQVLLGALLFHTMFIVSPIAGKNLFDNAQMGEYFRVFACYAVIAIALALHALKSDLLKRNKA